MEIIIEKSILILCGQPHHPSFSYAVVVLAFLFFIVHIVYYQYRSILSNRTHALVSQSSIVCLHLHSLN